MPPKKKAGHVPLCLQGCLDATKKNKIKKIQQQKNSNAPPASAKIQIKENRETQSLHKKDAMNSSLTTE